jgi:ribosomal protein L34
MKKLLLGAASLAIASVALAQAPVAPPPPPAVPQVTPAPMIAREHTRTEMVARAQDHFVRLDTNRDGFLTREEADAGRKVLKERIRTKLGERRANRSERRDPNTGFDRLDSNRDGSINREEFAQHREKRVERRIVRQEGVAGVPGTPGVPQRGMRMHRFGGMMGGQMFEMADANRDGRVSLQEATEAAARHFDMADANRDGRITPDERRQMRHQMIEKRRALKAG